MIPSLGDFSVFLLFVESIINNFKSVNPKTSRFTILPESPTALSEILIEFSFYRALESMNDMRSLSIRLGLPLMLFFISVLVDLLLLVCILVMVALRPLLLTSWSWIARLELLSELILIIWLIGLDTLTPGSSVSGTGSGLISILNYPSSMDLLESLSLLGELVMLPFGLVWDTLFFPVSSSKNSIGVGSSFTGSRSFFPLDLILSAEVGGILDVLS